MSREYQNGDGFGYLLSFRRQGSTHWQTARVPGADAQYFVYSNESVRPYTPFEVKIRSYNRRGEGPESLTALVYSAEEGGLPRAHFSSLPQPLVHRSVGWEDATHLSAQFHRRRLRGHLGSTPLASLPALATLSPFGVRKREALWEEKWALEHCLGGSHLAFILSPGLSSKILSKGNPGWGVPQGVSWESKPILYRSPEPRVASTKVWAKGVSSSEMNVTWEPVQQDMNGILLGYEVSTNLGLGRGRGAGASKPGGNNSQLTNHSSWHPWFTDMAN